MKLKYSASYNPILFNYYKKLYKTLKISIVLDSNVRYQAFAYIKLGDATAIRIVV